MSRTRASAKAAGARFERLIADCLAEHIDDRIDRRVTTGAKDKGDIANVRSSSGARVVVEAKDYGGRYDIGTWLREAETERSNDGADVGLVVAKRRGHTDGLDQVVVMTVRDLVALVDGERPMSDLLDLLPATDGRLTCGEIHLPGCHSPSPAHLWPRADGVTACICGAYWWPGKVGTWHSTRPSIYAGQTISGRNFYEPGPWRHYHLHANHCPERETDAQPGHLCEDVEPATAAEAWERP